MTSFPAATDVTEQTEEEEEEHTRERRGGGGGVVGPGRDNAVSKAAGRASEQSVQERAYLSDTRAESQESDSSRSPANKTACSLSALSGPEELEPVLL